jgi:hypothetical protein
MSMTVAVSLDRSSIPATVVGLGGLDFDGALEYLLEENSWRDRQTFRPNIGQVVCLFIAFPADVGHLAPLEVAFELVVHCTIRNHVCAGRVALLHDLLGDEVRVPVDLDACGATGFRHMHTVQNGFVLRFIVRGVREAHT